MIALKPLKLGLLGVGVGHSRSPQLHGAGLAALRRDGSYVLLESATRAELEVYADRVRSGEMDGLNITTPWKTQAAQHCDRLYHCDYHGVLRQLPNDGMPRSPVNTLFRRDGLLCGTSTDGPGLGLSLRHVGLSFLDLPIALIGAGGAAASVAAWLLAQGADLRWICNRSATRAQTLAASLPMRADGAQVAVVPWQQPAALTSAKLVFHASRVGHGCSPFAAVAAQRQLSHLPWRAWAEGAVLVDLVYGDGPTTAQRCAYAAGATDRHVLARSGQAMLACQAALSLSIWADAPPPIAAMLAVLTP